MTTLSSINGVAASESTSASMNELSETYDMFLRLLTAQMQNQDPLDPMDNSEYINQLVQFTHAEQAIGTNDRLAELIGLQEDRALNDAVGFIGQTVRADSGTLELVDGQSALTYGLFSNAAETKIVITDREGNTVRTLEGETGTGLHTIVWDGLGDYDNPLADGIYNFEVTATDNNGKEITTAQGVEGEITGLEMSGSEVVLKMGEIEIRTADISAILPISQKEEVASDKDEVTENFEEASEEAASGLIGDPVDDAKEALHDTAQILGH